MIRESNLIKYFSIDKLVYHSLDQSLYQVSVIIEGEESYISDDNGKLLRSHNLNELQKKMRKIKAKKTVLRQDSAYDEMIGGTIKISANTLEVPLADNNLY